MMKTFLLFCLLVTSLAFAGVAHAAGGTCPSGANYTSLTNPAGSLVTLSSLGITSCYFVAASGADTNSGTSEGSPWLHAPGMNNCANNCSTSVLAAGIGIIFRGGDTWHFGNSGATPYAGVVTGCSDNGNNAAGFCLDDINATSAHPIYAGVDVTWFTGGSWVRPVFTADNPLCGLGNTPAGCTNNASSSCLPSAGSACTGVYYVSSCTYQLGNSNILVDVGFSQYIIVDDLELTGLCQSHTGQPGGFDSYFNYSAFQAPIYLTRNYIHGASHQKYVAPNGQPACVGALCINLNAFYGAVGSGSVGESVFFNVVDFSDSDPVGENLCQCGFYNIAYNYFGYTTQALPSNAHLFHDNLYEYLNGNGHSNGFESKETTTAAFYNNVIRHVQLSPYADGGVVLWLGPQTGITDYIFNNVLYDVGSAEYLNNGGTGLTTNNGNYTYFNNTFQSNTSQALLTCGSPIGTLLDVNNHWINNQAYNTCGATSTTTSLLMSNSTATSNGYTSSQTYAYSPTVSGSPTVGVGTNVQSAYCAALTTAGLTDAASACAKDSRYGMVYNATTHTVSYPGRTANSRPASAAFDIGAYQFSSNGNMAVSPTSQNFGSLTVGTPSSPVTFTITNNNTATATSITIPANGTGGNSTDFATTNTGAGSCSAAGGTLAQSASCTFSVIFTPGAAGSRSTTLNITYSGSDGLSPLAVGLSGIGIATTTFSGTQIPPGFQGKGIQIK